MKTRSNNLLVNATGQLMQQHAFDHLSDEKLSRMNQCLHRLVKYDGFNGLKHEHNELLQLCSEADLYSDTATPESLNQWFTVMSCFGLNGGHLTHANEAAENDL